MTVQTSATVLPWAISCSAVLRLRMIYSAMCLVRFMVKPGPVRPDGDPHSPWTDFRGPRRLHDRESFAGGPARLSPALLIVMPSGGQKVANTSDEDVDARQIPLEVARLLPNGLAYLVDTGPLLLGHSKKLLPRLYTVRTRFMTKALSVLRMHRISQDFSRLPRFIEQR